MTNYNLLARSLPKTDILSQGGGAVEERAGPEKDERDETRVD